MKIMKIMYSKRKQCCTLRFVFFVFFLRLFYGCSTTIAIHESESLELSRALCSSGPTGAATAGIRRADGSAGRAVEVFRRQHLPAAVHEQGDVLPERGAEGGVRTNESQKRTNKKGLCLLPPVRAWKGAHTACLRGRGWFPCGAKHPSREFNFDTLSPGGVGAGE